MAKMVNNILKENKIKEGKREEIRTKPNRNSTGSVIIGMCDL